MNMVKVKLRAIEPEDLDMLYRIENDTRLWGVGSTNVPYSRYALHDYIANASSDIYTDRQVRLIVENEPDNSPDGAIHTLGIADLVSFDPRHRRAEVGIVIASPHRRQGYALATLLSLQDYACRVLSLHQLYAVVGADNSAALSLFIKAGYLQVATLPQWLCSGNTYVDAALLQMILV